MSPVLAGAPAARADMEPAARVNRQSMPPSALNRCGDAEPRVSAPTRSIKPMSPFAQVEANSARPGQAGWVSASHAVGLSPASKKR
jgi:hypothetical protein